MTLLEFNAHVAGYLLLAVVWFLIPMAVVKDPLVLWKRALLAVWYLGAMLALGLYLVTR